MCACVGKERMCVCKSVCAIYLRETVCVCVCTWVHTYLGIGRRDNSTKPKGSGNGSDVVCLRSKENIVEVVQAQQVCADCGSFPLGFSCAALSMRKAQRFPCFGDKNARLCIPTAWEPPGSLIPTIGFRPLRPPQPPAMLALW